MRRRAVPSWNDLGTAFNTLRELDVAAITEESEHPVSIGCFGPRFLFTRVVQLLTTVSSLRYGPVGQDPFWHSPLPLGAPSDEVRRADLLLVLVDGRAPMGSSETRALTRLSELAVPLVIAICGVTLPGELGQPRPTFAHAHIVVLPDLSAPEAAETLATALLERLPTERHLAVARAVPGFRSTYARDLVNAVALTNATYAFASSIPEQIPILSVPFVAADLIVLTKNQALLVYRLALAHGAPPEFQARMTEIAPVVGGAFVWRQVARTLVGLIPFWGVVPKVAVAYAGTYATGSAAWHWYAEGQRLSSDRLKEIADEALRAGRERAAALIATAREQSVTARKRFGLPTFRRHKAPGK